MAQQSTESLSPETGQATAETPEQRHETAAKLVDRFAVWSGVAGLIPLPVVDVLAVGGLQLQMLRRVSQLYDVQFSENRGKALIPSLAGTMIPVTSGMGAASALKGVPLLGIVASAFVMPVLSAGATYAIGKAFIQHFESGGTLLDFNPPDYKEFIKAQKEMWNSRSKRSSVDTQTSHPGSLLPRADASQSRSGCTGESATAAERRDRPHGGNHHICRLLHSHRSLRHRPPNGLLRHVRDRAHHHPVGGTPCAAAHRPVSPRRVA